ncbi:hypothetical protein AGMMS49960_15670 [Betaproteobacteria bacterium]|nr:hypothetical protein AGMMS49543_17270 [Betaproteobacteria bacterium]GHU02732.1 hypothetical protein AGMMS49960_15670 [Betaproteobacteria bacterium]GHU21662.1 hypothetical protein AGMMS50243_19790 [Betaproteobacteria bacterium]GHU26355.1 hypothetical protein FACS189488_14480 [Betaproteobacteria bacterium]
MPELTHRLALILALCLSLLIPLPAMADDSRITYAEIVSADATYILNADFALDFNPRLEEALAHGVALHFVAEIKIERPRWYWLDEVVVDQRLEFRLAYHALTRSYRLNVGNLRQNFDTLRDALNVMQHIHNWQIARLHDITPGVSHQALLRFRHDTAQLPGPFQLSAVASRDWQADTGWMEWIFMPGVAASR